MILSTANIAGMGAVVCVVELIVAVESIDVRIVVNIRINISIDINMVMSRGIGIGVGVS
jgi:hypothetical protein